VLEEVQGKKKKKAQKKPPQKKKTSTSKATSTDTSTETSTLEETTTMEAPETTPNSLFSAGSLTTHLQHLEGLDEDGLLNGLATTPTTPTITTPSKPAGLVATEDRFSR